MTALPTESSAATATAVPLDDEFDIDLSVLAVEPRPWFDSPDPSQPGSTCHFSCQDTCGGTCTCPTECGS